MNPAEQYKGAAFMRADLQKSGLIDSDLKCRPLNPVDIQTAEIAVGGEGYLIPYFDIHGKALPYWRARVTYDPGVYTAGKMPKYKQPKDSLNHVYYPRGFWPLVQSLLKSHQLEYILFTEGEKKAALAVKMGFPCVAVGGIENWRNRQLKLPKGTQMSQRSDGQITAKAPKGKQPIEVTTLAVGMQELIDFSSRNNVPLLIVYDSDVFGEAQKFDILRAAAILGYELRNRGIPSRNIRHFSLEHPPVSSPGEHIKVPLRGDETYDTSDDGETPIIDLSSFEAAGDDEPADGTLSRFGRAFSATVEAGGGKVGIDDYLLHPSYGPQALRSLIQQCLRRRSAFPRHPAPKEFISRRLAKPSLSRADYQSISFAIVSDMDAKGIRIKSETGAYYYFDYYKRRLYPVILSIREIGNTDIGNLLYSNYGISCHADSEVLKWFLPQYQSEEPLIEVNPKRLVATGSSRKTADNLYVQLNDGQFAKVAMPTKENPNPELEILDNGDEDILFEAGQTQGVHVGKLMQFYNMFKKQYPEGQKMPNWWYGVLKEARIADVKGNPTRQILSYLYYLSPFYFRWRGTELPVEIATGEAGSGKSTLYSLRGAILTGTPKLRNVPKDMKDFTASAASTGGLYVMDNVHMADKSLRQKMSDEICRLVTEPVPSVEQRKLYTDNELIRIAINCVFGLTSIEMPFTNVDIIQRSIVVKFDKQTLTNNEGEVEYDSNWSNTQITRKGGREAWLAFHLLVLERLQKLIYQKWDPKYKAKYRLINLEQLMVLCAELFVSENELPMNEVLGITPTGQQEKISEGRWVGVAMQIDRDARMLDTDAALSALREFAEVKRAQARSSNSNVEDFPVDVRDMVSHFLNDDDYMKHPILTNTRSLGKYLQSHAHSVVTTAGIRSNGTYGNRTRYQVLKEPKKG